MPAAPCPVAPRSITRCPIARCSRFPVILLVLVGAALGSPAGCSSSPRLDDRASTADQIDQIAKRRAEAVRLTREAERISADDPDLAIETYRRALALDDGAHNAWNNLGTLYMDKGNFADAVAAYQVAADLIPNDPRPLYNIGIAYQRNGWGEEAFRNFSQALERDPSHLPSMRGFVRAAEMTGRADARIVSVIRNAMMRDTDEQWRNYLQRQRYRAEALMEIQR
jgi:tetratricopeptide (TPR) repeat protein